MGNILLFIKDFELGSKVSGACVDHEKNVEFCDENSNPDDFIEKSLLAVIDLDEAVFFSVGLVSELKRHGIKILGTMEKVKAIQIKISKKKYKSEKIFGDGNSAEKMIKIIENLNKNFDIRKKLFYE